MTRPLLLATGFAFATIAQLCSLVHMAVVEHVQCEEHHRLEEGSAAHASTARANDASSIVTANAAVEHRHDACPLSAPQSTVAILGAVERVDALETALAVPPSTPARRYSFADLLLSAPKQGPPLLIV